MVYTLGLFDADELVSMTLSIIAFIFIYKAYRRSIADAVAKKFWAYFLLIALFVLLGRLFDILDDLALEPYFNLFQHLSSIAVAAVFVIAGKKTFEGGLNA